MKSAFLRGLGVAILLVAAFLVYAVVRNLPHPPNEYDVPVLERTLTLLHSEASWSKEDNRQCDPAAAELTLYCALRKASIEITGEFHHRAAALQAVRLAIDEVRPNNNYEHRLQDFNNAPDVQLDTVHMVLRRAIEELESGIDPQKL